MPASRSSRRFIGLMSGTSVDAVDAVLIEIDRSSSLSTIARASLDFPLALRRQIQSLQHPGSDELERSARVALDLADVYAEAVQEVLRDAGIIARDITALGAHGQTVRHPNAAASTAIGAMPSASVLASATPGRCSAIRRTRS